VSSLLYGRNFYSIFMKTKKQFVRGSTFDDTIVMHSQWEGPNTIVTGPVDLLWWLVANFSFLSAADAIFTSAPAKRLAKHQPCTSYRRITDHWQAPLTACVHTDSRHSEYIDKWTRTKRLW